ncbi:MAG: hypothetical protein V1861_01975 [Candidatus Micrarchaeota archaeon]
MDIRKNKILDRKDSAVDGKGRNSLKAKAVLVSTLLLGCAPDVTINNIPYDPTDGGTDTGACINTCEEVSGILREEGNTAGSNVLPVGNATLRFKGLVDEGATKAASLELEGCEGEKPSDSLKPGEVTTLTLNSGESADVEVVEMSYDGAGLRILVNVIPICEPALVDAGTGGSGGDGGDAGAGGSG